MTVGADPWFAMAAELEGDPMEPRFKPGDRVVRTSDDGETTRVEKGVVVWTWLNEQSVFDCYVAFFGAGVCLETTHAGAQARSYTALPENASRFQTEPGLDRVRPRKPYVLRYYDASLEPATEEG